MQATVAVGCRRKQGGSVPFAPEAVHQQGSKEHAGHLSSGGDKDTEQLFLPDLQLALCITLGRCALTRLQLQQEHSSSCWNRFTINHRGFSCT